MVETLMSEPYLPREILDYIIDLLRNERETLKRCCLVSKPWVPRTRKHLFAYIQFRSSSDLESWKTTFPDVANSPACHARELLVNCPWRVVAADAEDGGWIRAFSDVTSLEVTMDNGGRHFSTSAFSLTPFHNFSPALKSLHVDPFLFQYPKLSDLVCSFPLLENLSLSGHYRPWYHDDNPHGPQTAISSTSPALCGNLNLHVLGGGAEGVARQLLDLPNGLHFRHLALSWDPVEDVRWVMELATQCSHSLESLDVTRTFCGTSIRIWSTPITKILLPAESNPNSFNLSKATKLRDVVFRSGSQGVEWITIALQTIAPQHQDLRTISIHLPSHLAAFDVDSNIKKTLGEVTSGRWSDLDYLLVQFWESRSIRPRVGCLRGRKQNIDYCIGCLLPEVTKRGIVDPI